MKSELAFVGARGVDSYPYSLGGDAAQAVALKASGIDFFVGYLGVLDAARVAHVVGAGLAFMPVTLANRMDGAQAVAQCQALGLPLGCTVWLDLEGKTIDGTDWTTVGSTEKEHLAGVLRGQINAWASAILDAGYQPGLYVGSPQPLTGDELYALKVVRYWKAPSRIFDRTGKAWDGPKCGFCMFQLWPQHHWRDSGVFVDVDFVQQDLHGRLPSWAVTS